MLSRVEATYLAILRIFVLIVATIALLVSAVAFSAAVPSLFRLLGAGTERNPVGGSLGEYIEEKKATLATAQPLASAAAAMPPSTNADVQAAAAILERYTKGAGAMTIPKWALEIEADGSRHLASTMISYYKDVHDLADQLGRSKGARLSVDQVRELFTWNRQRFDQSLADAAARRAADGSRIVSILYVASVAFGIFIAVIFTFLFVRVERNLRLVRTVQMEPVRA